MRVQRITAENAKDAYLEINGTGISDLSGPHEGQVFFVESKTSFKGNPYLNVGVEIVAGNCQGQKVFGPVFSGRDTDRFLRALRVNPQSVGNALAGELVIGQKVLITVEAEDRVSVDGGTELRWVIRKFDPLPA